MAHFSDFDDFLSSEDKKQQHRHQEYLKQIRKQRTELESLLRDLFSLFKDYNETILQPRKEHFVVLKKQEELPPVPPLKKGDLTHFLYRVNVLPRILFAQQYNPLYAESEHYITPNKITRDDWYLKVALQFDTELSDQWDEQQKDYKGHLTPFVTLRSWGTLTNEHSSPLASHIVIKTENAWRKDFTTVSYRIEPENPNWKQDVKEFFMLVTPSILAHTREVYGIE